MQICFCPEAVLENMEEEVEEEEDLEEGLRFGVEEDWVSGTC